MNLLDYLVKQDDQTSMSIPECDNIDTDGKKDYDIASLDSD
ncbi:MAG: hypothetical protein ACW9XA_07330 [Candidatus Nitrosopumilus sp. bin_6a]